jgi:hypothetical protein
MKHHNPFGYNMMIVSSFHLLSSIFFGGTIHFYTLWNIPFLYSVERSIIIFCGMCFLIFVE